MKHSLKPGIEGIREIVVADEHIATAFGSGTLSVFATPSMIALMEQTAMESVAEFLSETDATVGTEVNIRHLKASLPGTKVRCTSLLISAEGRKLIFEVSASDETGFIGKGTHTRYIIDKQMFINNISK